MSAGDDIFVVLSSDNSLNIDGEEGNDTVDYSNLSTSIGVNLSIHETQRNNVSDTLINIENIIGTNLGDGIFGDNNNNIFFGMGGQDLIIGGLGNDQLYGGDGYDWLNGNEGSDTLYGGSGSDYLYGDDDFNDDRSRDYFYGEDGDDYLYGDLGADILNGGNGIDEVSYFNSKTAVSVNLSTLSVSGGAAEGDTLVSIENLSGSQYNDIFSGDANSNTLSGNYGNDTLKGRDGDDLLNGGVLSDYLEGGNGNDILNGGEGADTLKGSAGVDTFVYKDIWDAGDIIQDFNVKIGEKIDFTALLKTAINFIEADAFTGGYLRIGQNGLNTDIFVDMDGNRGIRNNEILLVTLNNVTATTITPDCFILPTQGIMLNKAPVAANDSFIGTQDLKITGNLLSNNGHGVDNDPDGNALSVLAESHSTLHGTVEIHTNGDFIYTPTAGYIGTDSFSYTLSDGRLSDTGLVDIKLNQAPILGTEGNDKIFGTAGNDIIRGLKGDDFINGGLGNDSISGNIGNDTLKGHDGNDSLYGGAGNDYLEGGEGKDILNGGLGADTLKGGYGQDTFVFKAMNEAGDTIADYNYKAFEKIDIADLLDLYDPLTHAITDFVRITQDGANNILAVDVNGGADNFVNLVTLLNTGVELSDEQAMVNSGRLLV